MLVDVERGSALDDPAPEEQEHPIAEEKSLVPVVGDVDRGGAGPAESVAELRSELGPPFGIDGGERLVEEDDRRPRGERAREGDPLPFAPRERLGRPVLEPVEVEELDDLVHPAIDLLVRPPSDRKAVGDVLPDRPAREERRLLEQDPDPASVRGDVGHVPSREPHLSSDGALEARDRPKQGRLPAAVRTHQYDELPGADREVDVGEDLLPSPNGR